MKRIFLFLIFICAAVIWIVAAQDAKDTFLPTIVGIECLLLGILALIDEKDDAKDLFYLAGCTAAFMGVIVIFVDSVLK